MRLAEILETGQRIWLLKSGHGDLLTGSKYLTQRAYKIFSARISPQLFILKICLNMWSTIS